MPDYVVLKQITDGSWADYWEAVYVDVTAETPEEAISITAKDNSKAKGGEGRYIAIPNEYWVAQNVNVKRIAEVTMERQEMI